MGELEAAQYVLIGTIVGALAGVAGSVATSIVGNIAEGKRQLLQIAFESARYEIDTQLKMFAGKKSVKVYPFTLVRSPSAPPTYKVRDTVGAVELQT